jgi:hypothetical protein
MQSLSLSLSLNCTLLLPIPSRLPCLLSFSLLLPTLMLNPVGIRRDRGRPPHRGAAARLALQVSKGALGPRYCSE